jgi:hypothetical protein
MDLIVHACNIKALIAKGKALRLELRDLSGALEDVFGKDITQPESIEEAVQDLMKGLYSDCHEDPPEYLSALEMKTSGARAPSLCLRLSAKFWGQLSL